MKVVQSAMDLEGPVAVAVAVVVVIVVVVVVLVIAVAVVRRSSTNRLEFNLLRIPTKRRRGASPGDSLIFGPTILSMPLQKTR